MRNQLTITLADDYILVRSDGAKDYQFALHLWTEVAKVCRENDCFKVLGIAQTTIPVKTSEAYDHYKIFKQAGITSQFRIAWVELNPETFDTTYFIETVLQNRGLFFIRLFSEIEEAKRWLLEEMSET